MFELLAGLQFPNALIHPYTLDALLLQEIPDTGRRPERLRQRILRGAVWHAHQRESLPLRAREWRRIEGSRQLGVVGRLRREEFIDIRFPERPEEPSRFWLGRLRRRCIARLLLRRGTAHQHQRQPTACYAPEQPAPTPDAEHLSCDGRVGTSVSEGLSIYMNVESSYGCTRLRRATYFERASRAASWITLVTSSGALSIGL